MDPKLAWVMFHCICDMYREAKKQTGEFFKTMANQFQREAEERILRPALVCPQLPDTHHTTVASPTPPTDPPRPPTVTPHAV